MRRNLYRWIVVFAATTGAALTLVLSALADKEQIHLTAAGQAEARAAVLQRGDLGTSSGWTGGSLKPDLSSSTPCPKFQPKQSDLILTGAAHTRYSHAGLFLDSEAQVLKTAQMLKLDWQRSVLAPGMLPCLTAVITKATGSSTRVVSVRRIAFPRVAQYTYAIRVLLEVKTATAPVHVFVDVVLVGRGRTELTMMASGPAGAEAVTGAAEVRLFRALVSRVRA